MTEKRFTLTNRSLSKIGNDVAIADEGVPCTQRFVCNLLNELYEENEQLKHDATVLIQANQDYRRENEQLKGEVAHYKLILMSLEEQAKRISSIRSFKND